MTVVYIATNEAMPGLVKIGFTDNLERRMKQLSSSTGVPFMFRCYFAVDVKYHKDLEIALHKAFDPHRVNPNKEFFRLSPEQPAGILRCIQRERNLDDVTPKDDIEAEPGDGTASEQEAARRSNLTFELLNLSVGQILHWRLKEEITCQTYDRANRVTFDGEVMTLSAATRCAAKITGPSYASTGARWWLYNGERLEDIRRKQESP